MACTEHGDGGWFREWWSQPWGTAAETTLLRESSISRDLRTCRGGLGLTWVALVLELLISDLWVRSLAHTTYHANPILVDTSPTPCLSQRLSQLQGGLQGGLGLWPKDCAGKRLPNARTGEGTAHMWVVNLYLSGPIGPAGGTQTSSAETWGSNPPFAKAQGHSNMNTLFHLHTLGARCLKYILGDQHCLFLKPFPWSADLGHCCLFLMVKPTGFPHSWDEDVRETEVYRMMPRVWASAGESGVGLGWGEWGAEDIDFKEALIFRVMQKHCWHSHNTLNVFNFISKQLTCFTLAPVLAPVEWCHQELSRGMLWRSRFCESAVNRRILVLDMLTVRWLLKIQLEVANGQCDHWFCISGERSRLKLYIRKVL